ncbi:MAG: hypothetical protein MI866_15685 [Bacteroidales bacterium]|nr:hypothetical protein [Bacteroidales bacterium]
MKIRNYRLNIILLIVTLTSTLSIAQTINIEGIEINLNNLPLNTSYEPSIPQSEDNVVKRVRVFASDDKQKIAINSFFERYDGYSCETYKRELKVYDAVGKLKWQKELKGFITQCKLSSGGQFSHIIERISDNGDDFYKLLICDDSGNEVYSCDNVTSVLSSKDNNSLFFYKRTTGNRYQLFYKHLTENQEWSKIYSSQRFTIQTVTDNGKYAVAISDSMIQALNHKGEIIWTRKTANPFGNYAISEDGKVICQSKSKTLRIIDIEKDELIKEVNPHQNGAYMFTSYWVAMTSMGTKSIIANASIVAPKTTMIELYNKQGDLLHTELLKNQYALTSFDLLNNDNTIHILFDGLKVFTYDR